MWPNNSLMRRLTTEPVATPTQNEGRLSDFDPTGLDHRAMQVQTCAILQDKGRITTEVIQRSSGLPPQFSVCVVGSGRCRKQWLLLPFIMPDSSHLEPWGQGHPELRECDPTPDKAVEAGESKSRASNNNNKKVYSQASRPIVICLTGIPNYLVSDILFFLPISLFWNGNVSYACPTILFWKHITYLVLQADSQRGRGILPQDESYLTHI